MMIAHTTPITNAIANPVSATVAVRPSASSMPETLGPNSPSVTTTCGAGSRNRRDGSSTP